MTRIILKMLACAMCFAMCGLTACKDNKKGEAQSEKRMEMEQRAQGFLADARKSLAQNDFAAARQSIEQMRKDCYLALTGRRQGILLMDSIDCADAQQQLVKLPTMPILPRSLKRNARRWIFIKRKSCTTVRLCSRKWEICKTKTMRV